MTELKKALASTIYILIVFWVSTRLMPFFQKHFPDMPWGITESIAIIVPAFLLTLLGAALWVRPKLYVRWTDPRNGETLSGIVLRISAEDLQGDQLRLAVYCHGEKYLPLALIRYLIGKHLFVRITVDHAPVVCTVDRCSRGPGEKPYVKSELGVPSLIARLTGKPPVNNSLWVFANVNFSVNELLNGESWAINYSVETNGSKISQLLTKAIAVNSNTNRLSIETKP